MQKLSKLLLATIAVVASASPAFALDIPAGEAPELAFTVKNAQGQTIRSGEHEGQFVEGNLFFLGDQDGTGPEEIAGPGFELSLQSNVDVDPSILYAIGATNFTAAPLTFSFAFSTPIAGGPFDTSRASLSGSLTDSAAGNGVSATDVSQISEASPPLTNLGVDITPADCLGSGGGPVASYTCGPFGPLSNTFALTDFTELSTVLTFTLSPGGDGASFTGAVHLERSGPGVPEPMTMLLFGTGIAGVVARRRMSA